MVNISTQNVSGLLGWILLFKAIKSRYKDQMTNCKLFCLFLDLYYLYLFQSCIEEMFSTWDRITHHWEVLKFTSRFLANASFLIDHIHNVYIEHLVTKFEFDNEDSPELETLEDLLRELMGKCSGPLCDPQFLQVGVVPLRVQSKVYLFGEQVNAGGYFRQTENTDLENKVMSGPSTCVVEVATGELTVQEVCQAVWDQSQIVSHLFIKKCKDELTSTEEYYVNPPTSDCVLHEDVENPVPDIALNVVI